MNLDLSDYFKINDVFEKQYNSSFANIENDSKYNALDYISTCAQIVFEKAQKHYPNNGLHYINPVLILKKEIVEAADINNQFPRVNMANIINSLHATYQLVHSGKISSIAKLVVYKKLTGLCLFFGNIHENYTFKKFKTYNLDRVESELKFTTNLHSRSIIESVTKLQINKNDISNESNQLFRELTIENIDEMIGLEKTFILYKSASRQIDRSLCISYVNKYNTYNSFFDCIFTLISEKPFNEKELLDFARIVEGISFPLVQPPTESIPFDIS